jgi:WD40 repeat protein
MMLRPFRPALLVLLALPRAELFAQQPATAEVRRFVGHSSQVNSISFSPDGKFLVSSSMDKSVRLWDVETGKELARHEDHAEIVWRVAYSPDGRHILSGGGDTYSVKADRFKVGKDHTLRLWASDSLQELRRFEGHTHSTRAVALSIDGKQAISASYDGTMRLWDTATGKELRTIRTGAGSAGLALSPDGKTVLTTSSIRPPLLRLWDLQTGKELRSFKGHTRLGWPVAFAPDGKRVLSGAMDGTARLWDVQTGKQLRVLRHPTGVTGVAFYPDGQHAITTSGAQFKPNTTSRVISAPSDWFLRVWDLEKKVEVARLAGHVGMIMDVRVSPDGRHVATAGLDRTIRLWALPRVAK